MHIKILYGLLAFSSLLLAGNLYMKYNYLNPINGSQLFHAGGYSAPFTAAEMAGQTDCVSFVYTRKSGDILSLPCGTPLETSVGSGIAESEVYRLQNGNLYFVKHLNETGKVSLENPIPVLSPQNIDPIRISGGERYVSIVRLEENKLVPVIYYNEQPIVGADRATFSLVGIDGFPEGVDSTTGTHPIVYAKDNHSAYYKGVEIKGADPATFTFIPTGAYYQQYAKDKGHVYYLGDMLDKADPLTFKTFATQPYEGPAVDPYATDKAHAYYKNIIMTGVDVKTFSAVIYDYAKDINHVYKAGVVVPGADPKTFKFPVAEIG
jgi:hypothetical protein